MNTRCAVRLLCPLLAAAGLLSPLLAAGRSARTDPAAHADGQRTPPVFRCIFEDRSRMVIVRPGGVGGAGGVSGDLYLAFNPGTCGVQKVWRGGMLFRGKVWDFSQDNCAATDDSVIYSQAASTLAALPDPPNQSDGWSLHGLDGPGKAGADEGRLFAGPDSSLISPEFDAAGWQRVFIAFDETQRNGPFRVEVSDDGGATWGAQAFFSTTHGSSDEDWQFDFKLVERPASRTRVRWTLGPNAAAKRIRRVHVFGDRVPWTITEGSRTVSPTPVWRGYERSDGSPDGRVCTLMYDLRLADGQAVKVRQAIGSPTGGTVVEDYQITGLPHGGTLTLELPSLGERAARSLRRAGVGETPLGTSTTVSVPAEGRGSAGFTIITASKEHP